MESIRTTLACLVQLETLLTRVNQLTNSKESTRSSTGRRNGQESEHDKRKSTKGQQTETLKKGRITKSVLSRELNIGQKERIYVRSKLMKLKEIEYGKPSRNKTFTLHMGQTFKYRNRNRNLKLQDIRDKKGI